MLRVQYEALAKQQKLGLAIHFRRVLCCHLQAGADLILFVDAGHLANLTKSRRIPCERCEIRCCMKPAGSWNRPFPGERGVAVRSVERPGAEFRLHLAVSGRVDKATLLLGLNKVEPYHESPECHIHNRLRTKRAKRLGTWSYSCPSRKTCAPSFTGKEMRDCTLSDSSSKVFGRTAPGKGPPSLTPSQTDPSCCCSWLQPPPSSETAWSARILPLACAWERRTCTVPAEI